MAEEELKIGSKVWVADPYRSVYRRDEKGRPYGAPLPGGRFVEEPIVSETPRKWKTLSGKEARKKNPYETGFYTRRQVDAIVWRETHAHRIASFLRDNMRKFTNEELMKIAEIIQYDSNSLIEAGVILNWK